ncbi:hypothetical protein [Halobacillus andaensis]|uniref:hypothetical protein n=1 Tax=Halobacillus andaensis TaxID=1176239 RepID=UPI003D73368D
MNPSWKLILGLGTIALIRPLLSSLGLLNLIGQPAASLAITLVITVIWIAFVVWKNVSRPVITLLYAGVAYGMLAIVISAVMSPIVTGELQGPLTHPFGIVSVLITNAIWGTAAGVIAAGCKKAIN